MLKINIIIVFIMPLNNNVEKRLSTYLFYGRLEKKKSAVSFDVVTSPDRNYGPRDVLESPSRNVEQNKWIRV